ncbi:MAG: hypothetical protein GVX96_02940 [Bacteroidetes bacterium]|jgi:hypothetical protein|nr:hypothetical protein [Bacteroidota bacterium]
MKYLFTSLILFSIVILLSCGGSRSISYEDSLEEIQGLLSGSFASTAQSEADSQYLNIHLHIVPIWKERTGNWFYVEQALADKPETPYRQRMYRLVQISAERYKIINYAFRNPQVFTGKWKTPDFFTKYTEDIVLIKEGCGVYLNRVAYKHYEGETFGEDCYSDLNGASYATSNVEIRNEFLKAWDRGWDEDGNQVWGPTEGPYRFDRIEKETNSANPSK